jgi:hypothetical protein
VGWFLRCAARSPAVRASLCWFPMERGEPWSTLAARGDPCWFQMVYGELWLTLVERGDLWWFLRMGGGLGSNLSEDGGPWWTLSERAETWLGELSLRASWPL